MSKYKVGGYVRLSRDDDYSESDSIQRQMDLIKIIANTELDRELKEFYVDNGYSGTSLDRPGFNKLLDDITQGKINMIMVKDLSKSANVIYLDCLSKVDFNINNKIVLINCAGKEGGDDKTIVDVLKQLRNLDNIFVDLRPQLDIEIVNIAKQQGWNAYTGFGMNSRNDYVLLQKIQDITGINIPSFEQFAKLVKDAS